MNRLTVIRAAVALAMLIPWAASAADGITVRPATEISGYCALTGMPRDTLLSTWQGLIATAEANGKGTARLRTCLAEALLNRDREANALAAFEVLERLPEDGWHAGRRELALMAIGAAARDGRLREDGRMRGRLAEAFAGHLRALCDRVRSAGKPDTCAAYLETYLLVPAVTDVRFTLLDSVSIPALLEEVTREFLATAQRPAAVDGMGRGGYQEILDAMPADPFGTVLVYRVANMLAHGIESERCAALTRALDVRRLAAGRTTVDTRLRILGALLEQAGELRSGLPELDAESAGQTHTCPVALGALDALIAESIRLGSTADARSSIYVGDFDTTLDRAVPFLVGELMASRDPIAAKALALRAMKRPSAFAPELGLIRYGADEAGRDPESQAAIDALNLAFRTARKRGMQCSQARAADNDRLLALSRLYTDVVDARNAHLLDVKIGPCIDAAAGARPAAVGGAPAAPSEDIAKGGAP